MCNLVLFSISIYDGNIMFFTKLGQNFANALTEGSRLRKLNNLSQDQLAEKLNVSRQAISKWELGAMPDIENVIKISHYFDCSFCRQPNSICQ